jgi:hypothetical protein
MTESLTTFVPFIMARSRYGTAAGQDLERIEEPRKYPSPATNIEVIDAERSARRGYGGNRGGRWGTAGAGGFVGGEWEISLIVESTVTVRPTLTIDHISALIPAYFNKK